MVDCSTDYYQRAQIHPEGVRLTAGPTAPRVNIETHRCTNRKIGFSGFLREVVFIFIMTCRVEKFFGLSRLISMSVKKFFCFLPHFEAFLLF